MSEYKAAGSGLTVLCIRTMARVEQKLFVEVENPITKRGAVKFLTLPETIELRDFLNQNFPDNAKDKSNTNAAETAAVGERK